MRSSRGHGSFPAYGVPIAADHAGAPPLADLAHGDWREWAACRSEDDEWWFAHPSSRRHQLAVSICQACPVRRECLAASVVYAEEFGVWGGISGHLRPELVARLHAGLPLAELLDQVLDVGGPRQSLARGSDGSRGSSGSAA